jgi:hypothetical protein
MAMRGMERRRIQLADGVRHRRAKWPPGTLTRTDGGIKSTGSR